MGEAGEPTILPVSTVAEVAEDLLRFSVTDAPRLPTGYSTDASCGMVAPGELALMWARSGAGKSTWVLNVIANTPDVPTLVVNMEMTDRRQFEWLVPMLIPMSTSARDMSDVLRNPDDERYGEVVASSRAVKTLAPNLSFVSPRTPPTVDSLAATLDSIGDGGVRPVRVFIDHLSLMANARDYDGVCVVAAQLHQWAMQEGLAVYCLQQTGRGAADGGRNDGHIPVTLSSGVYGGEHDADWIFGMYQPQRDPRFKKQRWEFKTESDYSSMLAAREAVKGISRLQVIKNRPYGDLEDLGVDLEYHHHSRRLMELGNGAR